MKNTGILISMALLCGCSSTITVTKITDANRDTAKGQRFSLPVRFVMVEPKPEGTVEVKYVYLPDEDNTFALTGETVFGSNNINLTLANGVISVLAFKPNLTDVPAQMATSAGNVRADKITDKATAAKAEETARETLLKAISDAKLAVAQADAKVKLAEKAFSGDETKIVTYRIELESAKLKLADLERQRDLLGTANDPGVAATRDVEASRAYGPKFYRIEDSGSTISLIPVTLLVSGKEGVQQPSFRVRSDAGAEVLAPGTVAASGTASRPSVPQCLAAGEYVDKDSFVRSADKRRLNSIKPKKDAKLVLATLTSFGHPERVMLSFKDGKYDPKEGIEIKKDDELQLQFQVKTDAGNCPGTIFWTVDE